MLEYRITKYNPTKRDSSGAYLDQDEWTCFSEVGVKVNLAEYEVVENAYILSAIDLLVNAGVVSVRVKGLEDYQHQSSLKENTLIATALLKPYLQSVLRNEYWCCFEADHGFVHFGYDYYMYVGALNVSDQLIQKIIQKGLFVEALSSPYHGK